MIKKLGLIIRLSRYKEHLPFVIPLSILGTLLALNSTAKPLDWRFITVTLANILVVTYAFMINNVEDALDDAKDPTSKSRNPIASGELKQETGYIVSTIFAISAILLYFISGWFVFWVGLLTLILSHLYSWKKVRLKAWPVVDVTSHSLMLSTLLVLANFIAYSTDFKTSWSILVSATLISAYGQLYNQLRDFKEDHEAGLKNTAITLGQYNTRILMYLVLTIGIGSLSWAIYKRMFPFWLIWPLLASIPISFYYKTNSDMRGTAAINFTGSMQMRVLIIANVTLVSWLVANIFKLPYWNFLAF